MEYVNLGKSDLKVSRICMGGNVFGDKEEMGFGWLLDQEKTDEFVQKALKMGINFFDTANVYNKGKSEIYLGNALKKFAKREDVIITTKVFWNDGFLTKEAILRECDKSLQRLQTDYIDLYLIHKWDYDTPIEETLLALNELIKQKKVRYIGCSSLFAYQLIRAQETAKRLNLISFIVVQNHYNLIYREDERELLNACKEEGIVMTPYSPLAAGRLCRMWGNEGERFKNDKIPIKKYEADKDIDMPVIERVKELSEKRGVSMTTISLAWMLSKDYVAAPVVGFTKLEHMDDAVKAVGLKLTEEEIKFLEEKYVPHKISGVFTEEQLREHKKFITARLINK